MSFTSGTSKSTLVVGLMMATQRAHIVLPADLVQEIDKFVGPRGRSAFIAETVKAELRKQKLLAWLSHPEPAWKDEDHPDLAAMGSSAWVQKMREPDEEKMAKIMSHLDEPGSDEEN